MKRNVTMLLLCSLLLSDLTGIAPVFAEEVSTNQETITATTPDQKQEEVPQNDEGTSSKEQVVELEEFHQENKSDLLLLRELSVYDTPDFDEQTESLEKLEKFSSVKVQEIEKASNGTPVFKLENGKYISAKKADSVWKEEGTYFYTQPKYIQQVQEVPYYTDPELTTVSTNDTQKSTHESIKVLESAFSSEGIPSFLTERGYLKAAKSELQEFKVDPVAYLTSTPKTVLVTKETSSYSSPEFLKEELLKTYPEGTKLDVSAMVHSDSGIPVLQLKDGTFITAKKEFVEEKIEIPAPNLSNYYTTASGYFSLLTDDYSYSSVEFSDDTRVTKYAKGSGVKVVGVEYSATKYPRLKLEDGTFITANKKYIKEIVVDLSKYITTPIQYIVMLKDDCMYASPEFLASEKKDLVKKGKELEVSEIVYSSKGIPRLKLKNGNYVTANKAYVKESVIDLSLYLTKKMKYVTMLTDDTMYTGTSFSAAEKSTVVKKGSNWKVSEIVYTTRGIPRIKLTNGKYITANKKYVKEFTVDKNQYYFTSPGLVLVKTNDVEYKSVEFGASATGNKINKGTVKKVVGVAFSDMGYPRLKLENGNYITANKSYVQKIVSNYNNYILNPPKQIVMLRSDNSYSNLNFTAKAKSYSAGTVVKVSGVEYSDSGVPRLKIGAKEYLTANKAYVHSIVANYGSYHIKNPGYIIMNGTDTSYRDVDFKKTAKTYNKGTVVKISGIAYTDGGMPRLKINGNEYLTANKSYVQKIVGNYNDFYYNYSGRVVLHSGDYYYTNTSFSSQAKGSWLPANTVVNVQGVEISESGYPRLKTEFGYITANKRYVQATDAQERIYMNAPYYNQMSLGYPNGCEEVSLYMALAYLGATHGQNVYQVTNSVPRVPSWGNPHEGFNGSPTDSYGFHTIYPRAFTPYAQRYAPRSRDISGVDMAYFKKELMKGNPLVVWGTYPYLAPPIIDGTYYGSLKVANLHVWLINGFDGNNFHVSDPIYGNMWVSEDTVALSYSPNKMAVSIAK